MGMNLIYQDPKTSGSIWQGGYREIPWDLKTAGIHVVIYAASECPPLIHHVGAEKFSAPNDDSMAPPDHPIYKALRSNAEKGVKKTVDSCREGKNVLVTCQMGINRSGLIVALALKQLTDWTADKIIQTVQIKRPGALSNPSFISMIRAT